MTDEQRRNTFAYAFDVWETEFREDPQRFMNAAEIAALDVADLSHQRATIFDAILKKAFPEWDTDSGMPVKRTEGKET